MIAIYFDPKYRNNIKKFFEKLNVKYSHLSFQADYHSVYFVMNDFVLCETESVFKRRYPGTKIIDPEKMYGEY